MKDIHRDSLQFPDGMPEMVLASQVFNAVIRVGDMATQNVVKKPEDIFTPEFTNKLVDIIAGQDK